MSNNDSNWIAEGTEDIYAQLVEWRRHFHRYPELGFKEFQTAETIVAALKDLGAEIWRCTPTGVVAVIEGARPGPTVAIRADMDALPITEETGQEYASRHPGVMHACGHDAHMAIALGTAMLLVKNKERWAGTVKFLFQPAEECPPGGAKEMIEAGVLKNPEVKAVLGLHVFPSLPVGKVGLKEGAIMAADDNFEIEIIGESGHGANPHEGVDAIVVAAQVILALQTIVSRKADPVEPAVLSIGTIQGGVRRNVIASNVELVGTIRTVSQETREKMQQMLRQTLEGITASAGASYRLNYTLGYPATLNDPQLVRALRTAIATELGSTNVVELPKPSMGGEDFARYAEQVPGVFFMLGVGQEGKENYPWHHSKFDIDEEALKYGVRLMSKTAVEVLQKLTV